MVKRDYVNLKVYLERVENFLNFYENSVELEVAIGERRRSGFTQNLTSMILPGSNGISPIINVARVLVAAIDHVTATWLGIPIGLHGLPCRPAGN
jgi:ABC-type uncharacterized transport system involved in gliding motility auxiliary subunit